MCPTKRNGIYRTGLFSPRGNQPKLPHEGESVGAHGSVECRFVSDCPRNKPKSITGRLRKSGPRPKQVTQNLSINSGFATFVARAWRKTWPKA